LRLEELESRLTPASYAVNAHLEVSIPGAPADPNAAAHAVVFFESSVADYQVLEQGLAAGIDAVLLDASGDGLREMAAFLAGRHGLTAIEVVAHGSPGAVALGTAVLSGQSLGGCASELAVVGSALASGGELDLWSCNVADGAQGSGLVNGLAAATGAAVAAAQQPVGSPSLGGSWRLDSRVGDARAEMPFDSAALGAFHELLGTWSSAASLATARYSHTATLLQNGQVLVAGGLSPTFAPLASAELYDPASDTWTAAASMASARSAQTATLLQNGMVLVVGGNHGPTPLASAELYNPTTDTWSSAGSLTDARGYHTATLLNNGKVLIAGGFGNNGALASAELYDPATNTWSSAGNMLTERTYQAATLLPDGRVLVVGGRNNDNLHLPSAEIYDPTTNRWSSAASMAVGREYETASLLSNGKVLVAGGRDANNAALSSAELYDPASNTWSAAGTMTTARFLQTATVLTDGTVLVAGGSTPSADASSEIYTPATNTWSTGGSMTTPRTSHTATLLSNGAVLVTGGYNDSTASSLTGAELFNSGSIVVQATQFAISNLSPTTVTSGGAVTFTVTAEDNTGKAVPGYAGTVQLTSTDSKALFGGSALPASYTFTANDSGVHTFTVTLATVGTQTITVTDTTNHFSAKTATITVSVAFSKFVVGLPGGATVGAGSSFAITVQAADQLGNPVTSYNGPTNITIAATPADGQGNLPLTGTLSSSGFGLFLGSLKTAGSYTLTATAGAFTGTSPTLTVTPAAANHFTVVAPANALTGSSLPVTVTALDAFGNVATGYGGQVHFTSSDPAASLPADTTLANGVGIVNVALKTAGSQTVTATDAVSVHPTITGVSNTISTRGLTVSAFTPTATGFTVTFSKPITAANVSLWGGTVAAPVQNVSLTGTTNGAIPGSFIIDPSGTSATFKATSTYLQGFFSTPVLPNDTYKVVLASGAGAGASATGFFDALGVPLDGANNGGHANFTTTFTTANDGKPALSIPDFARGPDGSSTVKVPNDTAKGIPVSLANAPAGTKDVVFTLIYNPTLLTPTGAGTGDSTGADSTFTMGGITNIDAAHSKVTFTWHNGAGLSGAVVLGDIFANVPDAAANLYKSKELLSFDGSSITLNGAPFAGVWANSVHLNAYFGDVSGDGKITGLDVATANSVAQGGRSSPLGFAAYRLVDPGLVGDIAGDGSVDAGAISGLAAFTANLKPAQISAIPTRLTITPGGADPTLSLGTVGRIGNPSYVTVPVLIDNPHPDGSTGMTEAILALTYDPKVLSVSSTDIALGSIPALAGGWRLESQVDAATGQIGIDLFSTTPITSTAAGSLVTITFHLVAGASSPETAVHLVSAVTPKGRSFQTEVADGGGQLVLSPGIDRLVVQTGAPAEFSFSWWTSPVRQRITRRIPVIGKKAQGA
jgi:N-acetylneuraminic acid mutarotase